MPQKDPSHAAWRLKVPANNSEPPPPNDPARTERLGDPEFSTAEVSLLCCFGMDQLAERSHGALRAALADAGLPKSAVRHLIDRVRWVWRPPVEAFSGAD